MKLLHDYYYLRYTIRRSGIGMIALLTVFSFLYPVRNPWKKRQRQSGIVLTTRSGKK